MLHRIGTAITKPEVAGGLGIQGGVLANTLASLNFDWEAIIQFVIMVLTAIFAVLKKGKNDKGK
jgi:hypothetical protein